MLKMLVSAYECDKDKIVTKLLGNNKKITSRVIVTTLIEMLVCCGTRPYLTEDRMVITCNRKCKEYFYVIRGYKTLGIYTLCIDSSIHNKLLELHKDRLDSKEVTENYIELIRGVVSCIQVVYP